MLEQSIIPVNIDSDTTDTNLSEGAVRFILNCQIGSPQQSSVGIVTNKPGNTLISFSMPAGLNLCIGSYLDDASKSVFFFVYNNLLKHQILRYFYQEGTNGHIETILLDPILNFQANVFNVKDSLITGISFLDDKLYWTDSNGLHKLNTKKANNTGKSIIANVYFGGSNDGTYKASNTYTFSTILNGVTTNYTNTIASQTSLSALCNAYAIAFNLSVGSTFTFTSMGNWVQVTANNTDIYTLTATATGGFCQLIYQNIYPAPYLIDFIDLGKYPPLEPPTAFFGNDATTSQNQVQEFIGQFRFRYVYDDYEKSAWSPYSKLIWSPDENDPTLNVVQVNFGNDRLQSDASAIILRVEVAFRFLNNPVDNLVYSLEQYEYITGRFFFYNNNQYLPIAQPESLKTYDAIPIKSQSLEIIKDLLFVGGNTEGYDRVNMQASVSLGFNNVVPIKNKTITGSIRIINNLIGAHPYTRAGKGGADVNQPIHQFNSGIGYVFGGMGAYLPSTNVLPPFGKQPPDWYINNNSYDQRIPLGGFVVYLAGTPYYGVSKQRYTSTWVPFSGNFPFLQSWGNTFINIPMANSSLNVYDTSSSGFVTAEVKWVNGANLTQEGGRQVVRRAIQQNLCISDFEIKNVPPGTYYLRVASHWCYNTDTDPTGHGAIYNLNDPSLSWQNTSTNTYQVGGEVGYEIKIVVDNNGGIMTIGDTLIEDLSMPTDILSAVQPASYAATGYIYDVVGTVDPTKPINGTAMENQQIQVDNEVDKIHTGIEFLSTDHNGYWYYKFYTSPVFSQGAYQSFVNMYSIKPDGASSNLVIISSGDNMYRADLNDLFAGTLSSKTYTNNFDTSWKMTQYITINQNQEISNYCATYIEGIVVDQNNSPLSNITIVGSRCGRNLRTKSDGSFKLLVYGDMLVNKRDLSITLEFCFPYFKGNYISGAIEYNVYLTFSESGQYNISNPLVLTNVALTMQELSAVSYLKRGGLYQYAFIHFDSLDRCPTPTVEDSMKIRIPFYTEDLNTYDPVQWPNPGTFNYSTPEISWKINTPPPSWAVMGAWLRSNVLNYNTGYLQWIANSVQYVSGFDSSGSPINTSYAAGNATGILIDMSNLSLYNNNQLNVPISASPTNFSTIGYTFQVGDRIRLMKDNNSKWYTTYFDAPVKQQIGLAILIEALGEYPQIHAGTMFEIYNPVDGVITSIEYFEIGDFVPIINAGQSNARYASTSGNFPSGDTYTFTRLIPVTNTADSGSGNYLPTVESESITDKYLSKANDKGRVFIEDLTQKQREYASGYRWSNKYISLTQTNGLSSFDGTDNDLLPTTDGLITKMVKSLIGSSSVLFIIQQTNCHSLYVQEAQIKDLAGSRLIAVNDGIIGGIALMDGGFGSNYPESIIEYKGRIYGFSDNKATVFRYSRDGMKDLGIEGKRVNDLKTLALWLDQQTNPTYVLGGYDPYNDEYVITPATHSDTNGNPEKSQSSEFDSTIRYNQYTFTWNEKFNKWTSNYAWNAEFFGKVGGTGFLSFYYGQLWLHNVNPLYNNFYGVQYNSRIQAVFNLAPRTIKEWLMAGMKATDIWTWDSIETLVNEYSLTGQETSLIATDFSDFEGVFEAAILRDIRTPYMSFPQSLVSGNVMRGEVLHVELVLNSVSTRSILWHIFTRMLESAPTQTK